MFRWAEVSSGLPMVRTRTWRICGGGGPLRCGKLLTRRTGGPPAPQHACGTRRVPCHAKGQCRVQSGRTEDWVWLEHARWMRGGGVVVWWCGGVVASIRSTHVVDDLDVVGEAELHPFVESARWCAIVTLHVSLGCLLDGSRLPEDARQSRENSLPLALPSCHTYTHLASRLSQRCLPRSMRSRMGWSADARRPDSDMAPRRVSHPRTSPSSS